MRLTGRAGRSAWMGPRIALLGASLLLTAPAPSAPSGYQRWTVTNQATRFVSGVPVTLYFEGNKLGMVSRRFVWNRPDGGRFVFRREPSPIVADPATEFEARSRRRNRAPTRFALYSTAANLYLGWPGPGYSWPGTYSTPRYEWAIRSRRDDDDRIQLALINSRTGHAMVRLDGGEQTLRFVCTGQNECVVLPCGGECMRP